MTIYIYIYIALGPSQEAEVDRSEQMTERHVSRVLILNINIYIYIIKYIIERQ